MALISHNIYKLSIPEDILNETMSKIKFNLNCCAQVREFDLNN